MAGEGATLNSGGTMVAAFRDDPVDDKESTALAEYTRDLDDLIATKGTAEISNGSPLHARLVLTRLFQQATSDVEIYSGHLRQIVRDTNTGRAALMWAHPPLIDAAQSFLRKPGTSLSILVQNCVDAAQKDVKFSDSSHPFLKRLFEDSERLGTLELTIARGKDTRFLPISYRHFAVADERVFRLETVEDGIRATASFNGPRFAKRLKDYFLYVLSRLSVHDPKTNREVLRFMVPARTTFSPFMLPPEALSNPGNC